MWYVLTADNRIFIFLCTVYFTETFYHTKYTPGTTDNTIFPYLYYQVEVLMTPPRIEHVRTAQTRVTFGENFQVIIESFLEVYLTVSSPKGILKHY